VGCFSVIYKILCDRRFRSSDPSMEEIMRAAASSWTAPSRNRKPPATRAGRSRVPAAQSRERGSAMRWKIGRQAPAEPSGLTYHLSKATVAERWPAATTQRLFASARLRPATWTIGDQGERISAGFRGQAAPSVLVLGHVARSPMVTKSVRPRRVLARDVLSRNRNFCRRTCG